MSTVALAPSPLDVLRERFAAVRAERPKARIRHVANELGASEAELVATEIDGRAIRIRADWRALVAELETLGDVMALTRNDACVHEKTGVYRDVRTDLPHKMALVLDEQIDLRLFCGRWKHAFAVETAWDGAPDGRRRSLQFFDTHGDAVHKVFLNRKSDYAAYDALVERHRAGDAEPLTIKPRPTPAETRPDAAIDGRAFLDAWAGLQDTHDFFSLLREHDVARTQALRLAEGRFTERVALDSPRRLLEGVAADGTPIMVFVGNPGAIQIHTGPVREVKEHGPWFNVLDPGFNLHLREDAVAEAWVVVKPTEDGDVTALEAFDADGRQIVQFFGKRKPGVPELQEWRDALAALPRL
jgi:putative hemin transport protein